MGGSSANTKVVWLDRTTHSSQFGFDYKQIRFSVRWWESKQGWALCGQAGRRETIHQSWQCCLEKM